MSSVSKLLIILLLVPSVAMGATITSRQSGPFNSADTWDTFAVPGSGDTAVVSDGFTVTGSGTSTCDQITVQSGGTLTTSGKWVVNIPYFLISAGATFTTDEDSLVGNVAPVVGNGYTWMNISGTFTPAAGAHIGLRDHAVTGTNQDELIHVTVAGTLEAEGEVVGSGRVMGFDPSVAPILKIQTAVDPGDATHVSFRHKQIGQYITKLKIVSYADGILTLKDGKVAVNRESTAAGDSLLFVASPDSMDVFKGAMANWGSGVSTWDAGSATAAVVKQSGSNFASYFRKGVELSAAIDAADSVMFTDGIYVGQGFNYLKMVTFFGSDVTPTVASAALEDNTEGSFVYLQGAFDFDYVSFENINAGVQSSAMLIETWVANQDMDHTLFLDGTGGYLTFITDAASTPGSPRSLNFQYNYAHRNWMPYVNETDGHWMEFDDQDDEDDLTLQYCGFRYGTDDFIFFDSGVSLDVFSCFYSQDIGTGSFIDTGLISPPPAAGKTLTVRGNYVFGTGDITYKVGQVDAASGGNDTCYVDFISSDNEIYQGASRFNRDANNIDTTSAGAIAVYQCKSFSSTDDLIWWNPGYSIAFNTSTGTDKPDSVYVRRANIRYNGYQQGPSGEDVSVTWTNVSASGIASLSSDARVHLVIVGCDIRDLQRLGASGEVGFSANLSGGVTGRAEAASAQTASVRGCYFNQSGAKASYTGTMVRVGDANLTFTVQHCTFRDGYNAFVGAGGTGAMYSYRSLYVDMDSRYIENVGGGTFKQNTFFATDSAHSNKRFMQIGDPAKIIGNLFLRDGGATMQAIQFVAVADTADVCEYNAFVQPTDPIMVNGVSISYATWQGTWNKDLLSYNNTGADDWSAEVLNAPNLFKLRPTSSGVDLISFLPGNVKDPEGTNMDVGCCPSLSGGFRVGSIGF